MKVFFPFEVSFKSVIMFISWHCFKFIIFFFTKIKKRTDDSRWSRSLRCSRWLRHGNNAWCWYGSCHVCTFFISFLFVCLFDCFKTTYYLFYCHLIEIWFGFSPVVHVIIWHDNKRFDFCLTSMSQSNFFFSKVKKLKKKWLGIG